MLYGDKNPSKRPEVRLKISLAKKGKSTWNKGNHLTKEWKKNIGLSNKGFRTKTKVICLHCKKQFYKFPSQIKISQKHFCSKQCSYKFKTGLNHSKWIEDRTKIKKQEERNNPNDKQWKYAVYKRDNFQCKLKGEKCKGKIESHHILSWKEYPQLRFQINNGITLCHAHHPRKRAEEKRLESLFKKLVSVSKV